MRQRIADRLKASQNTAAMLTTFNEIDMTPIMTLRDKYKDEFAKKHGVKLGFMSPFAKACAIALQDVPSVNASWGSEFIEFHDFVDISVAVSTPKGLVVPVLRDVQKMNLAQIEKKIEEFGNKARDNKLQLAEMTGGTFTISNGGTFGSWMGTPIINPPQSAILGMHAIKKKPWVVGGQIVVRDIMAVALTYDHRLIDGRDAVTFLVKVKNLIEDPSRMVLDLA
jgi:2-oxoglutarate dehydrogenase E2 component (dihydrolipoamide succinyltransferase)